MMESIDRIEPDHPSIAAVDQCAGDPDRLVALSELLGFTGETRQ